MRASWEDAIAGVDKAKAQMKVVLFATHARFLRFRIENGLQLIVRGRLGIYGFGAAAHIVARGGSPS